MESTHCPPAVFAPPTKGRMNGAEMFAQFKRPAITTTSFLPARVPQPRPWHRIAVPAICSASRERRIWKRAAVAAPSGGGAAYAAAALELKSQGLGSRKRARRVGHVPAWGDARWDPRVRESRDGVWDLVEARVSIAATKAEQPADPRAKTRPATFPEERLQFVPRKRHNSRFPVRPPQKTAPLIADDQPLVEFDVPTQDLDALAGEAAVKQADSKKMRRRSTRRLSRRISLAPIHEAAAEEPAIVSPVKSTPYYTPLRRRCLASAAPKRVALSDVRAFRVFATPNKVTIGGAEPKMETPPPSTATPTTATPVPAEGASPALIFDQPMPEIALEPEHEARRYVSLQKSRRSKRRTSGVQRMLDFETKKAPNRRHSFMPLDMSSTTSKGRRHTLDIISTGGQDFHLEVTSPDEEEAIETPESTTAAGPNLAAADAQDMQDTGVVSAPLDSAVDVDVRANLDIFGQSPTLTGSVTESPEGRRQLPVSTADGACESSLASMMDTSTPLRFDAVRTAVKNVLGIVNAGDTVEGGETSEQQQQAATGGDKMLTRGSTPQLVDIHHASSASPTEIPDKTNAEDAETAISDTSSSAQPQPEIADGASPENISGQVDSPIVGSLSDMTAGMRLSLHPHGEGATEIQTTPQASSLPAQQASTASIRESAPAIAPRAEPALDIQSSPESEEASTARDRMAPLSPPAEAAHIEDAVTCEAVANEDTLRPPLKDSSEATACLDAASDETPPPPEGITFTSPPDLSQPGAMTPSPVGTGEETREEVILETPPQVAGFIPINGRSSSSPRPSPPPTTDHYDDTITMSLDVDPPAQDEDATVTMALDTEEAAEENTMTHDDSETEMLRNFVTRVKADKSAKAAAAARAKASNLRPKRRSGSTGSTTSASGSPVSRSTPSMNRLPLGEKDPNSPSPIKKRKGRNRDDGRDDSLLSRPALDDTSPPRPKRRRKKMEADTGSIFNPEFQQQSGESSEVAAPRRSTRSRNAKVPLKPTAPSANGALSLIPVRLPGSLNLGADDGTGFATVNLGTGRKEEKDLAAVTRVNTRKNKGNSLAPSMVLTRQSEDPGWRMRELKGVFDAREAAHAAAVAAEGGGEDATEKDGRKNSNGEGQRKAVRWADVLVRVQGDGGGGSVVLSALVSGLKEDEGADVADAENETLEVVQPEPVVAPKKPSSTESDQVLAQADNRPAARRTRASKLQAPTPREVLASAAKAGQGPASKGNAAPTKALPAAKVPPSASIARMATRRNKLSVLGMSGNGTPAPKRRAGRGVS